MVASFGGTMKERLRSGEYFTFHCPRCQERSFYAHPMLYHDPQKRFMLILNEEESHLDHEKDVICVQVHTGEANICAFWMMACAQNRSCGSRPGCKGVILRRRSFMTVWKMTVYGF